MTKAERKERLEELVRTYGGRGLADLVCDLEDSLDRSKARRGRYGAPALVRSLTEDLARLRADLADATARAERAEAAVYEATQRAENAHARANEASASWRKELHAREKAEAALDACRPIVEALAEQLAKQELQHGVAAVDAVMFLDSAIDSGITVGQVRRAVEALRGRIEVSAPEVWRPGDVATWRHDVWDNIELVPVEVVSVEKSRVRVRAPLLRGGSREVSVKPSSLTRRKP